MAVIILIGFLHLFAFIKGVTFNINSKCHPIRPNVPIYRCGTLQSGEYTMKCDSDVTRVMFRRFHEAVEIEIFRRFTPALGNIKAGMGECPLIYSDMDINVEVDDKQCLIQSKVIFSSQLQPPFFVVFVLPHIPNFFIR